MILAWGSKVSPAFRAKVVQICASVGIPDPSYLMACMAFETGMTFRPDIRNPASGATGLIQFMPRTAERMDTTTDALAAKSAEDQLDDVARYLQPYRGRLQSITDCYMAILWPAAIGKPDDAPLFSATDTASQAYVQNKGLDLNHDGVVTKGEATAKVGALYEAGVQPPNGVEMEPAGAAPAAPAPSQPKQDQPMPILALAQIFGPIIAQLIPQIGVLFGGKQDAKNVQAIGAVLDSIVKATGQDGPTNAATVGAAVDAMQSDPAAQKAARDAVVTNPVVVESLRIVEVGGGAAAAREADVKMALAEVPFYKGSAVFWVSVLLLPLVYWLVGSLIVGGMIATLKDQGVQLPTWANLLLALFGNAWNGESRSGGFNLVIGLVLGGMCGVYYGVSVTQAKQQALAAAQKTDT